MVGTNVNHWWVSSSRSWFPTVVQLCTASRMECTICWTILIVFLKTFLSNHSSQIVRMMTEPTPGRTDSGVSAISETNQSCRCSVWVQFPGIKDGIWIQHPTYFQISLATGHSQKRWCAVFKFLRHSWQKYSFGHPLTCRRAAVQILFCSRSHKTNLHFGGALIFQSCVAYSHLVLAMKCAA